MRALRHLQLQLKVLAAALLVGLTPIAGGACCLCGGSVSLDEMLQDASAIFIGVVEAEVPTVAMPRPDDGRVLIFLNPTDRAARVRIVQAFRGIDPDRRTVTVFSSDHAAHCGLELEVGEAHLFLTWPAPYRGLYVHFTDHCHSLPVDLDDSQLTHWLTEELHTLPPPELPVQVGDPLVPPAAPDGSFALVWLPPDGTGRTHLLLQLGAGTTATASLLMLLVAVRKRR